MCIRSLFSAPLARLSRRSRSPLAGDPLQVFPSAFFPQSLTRCASHSFCLALVCTELQIRRSLVSLSSRCLCVRHVVKDMHKQRETREMNLPPAPQNLAQQIWQSASALSVFLSCCSFSVLSFHRACPDKEIELTKVVEAATAVFLKKTLQPP